MSIQKATQIGSVSGNFWRAGSIYISPDHSHSRVTMYLYLDQSAYRGGSAPLYSQDFLMLNDENPFTDLALNAVSDAKLVAVESLFSGGVIVSGV